MPTVIAQAFPNARVAPGIMDDWEVKTHMGFEHGFKRLRESNAGRVDAAWYCVVDETEPINGKVYRFGDRVELTKGGTLRHTPNNLLGNRETLIVSGYVEGSL